jgi:hypothetical protein
MFNLSITKSNGYEEYRAFNFSKLVNNKTNGYLHRSVGIKVVGAIALITVFRRKEC